MRLSWRCIPALLIAGLSLSACMPLQGTRAAASSAACVRAALDHEWPAGLSDKQKHCRGTASIAARCSVQEARLAGILKEAADLFGPGNAEAADLRADWKGVRCARASRDDDEIDSCCDGGAPVPR